MIKSDGLHNNLLQLHVIPFLMSKKAVASGLILSIFQFDLSMRVKYDTFKNKLEKGLFRVLFFVRDQNIL
jgi:hypothetical protein